MSPTEQIQQLLSHKPGLKAQQIADELGLERSQVINMLHGPLGETVAQDNAYRWWPNPRPHLPADADSAPRTILADLCRYYLDCLSRESGAGTSLPVDDGSAYVVLQELPFALRRDEPWRNDRAARKIIQKARRERGQLALYIGYAIRLRTVCLKDYEERRIEPVLLYPIDETSGEHAEPLRPVSGIPIFNLEVLKSLPAADTGNVIDEASHLSEELGLANPEDELPQWDEIILRLQRCRPDWGWREDLNPYALSGAPLEELTAPGIYNRAILFAGSRSPFTYGLEMELRKLSQLGAEAVENTALGLWLRGEEAESAVAEERPLLEILPLNTEQRQAVLQGLTAPLTVVTGPPGTGKSQVVASLLANVAWQGGSVLFSSKNNHAVDVVETRVNALGPSPVLLRLGREEHHARIAQHLTAALAESSTPDGAARHEWLSRAHEQDRARFAAIRSEVAAVVALRNEVDELERSAEPARGIFGQQRFADLRTADLDAIERRLQSLGAALLAAKASSRRTMARILWDRKKQGPGDRLAAAATALISDAAVLGCAPPREQPQRQELDAWDRFHDLLVDRCQWARRVQEYWRSLERLRAARPLEALACEITEIAEESAQNSLELWQSWLRLWPSRWRPEQRKLLSEYLSLLQMVAAGERHDESAGKRVFRRYYSLFGKIARILPCWAVTSLSTRGRLPFEPALFDLVVIDEASQCDIASALPLLFRARRAVIIGDPLQLKHVSTVPPQEDRLILAAHGLAEGRAAWAYSVNSLFDLARSVCRHKDIVNLRDHYRSHRDIIGFSNRHFYRGRLRVATDHESLKPPQTGGPAVRWINLRGKVIRPPGGGALNPPEAEAVVSELRKLIVDQGYNGSIGVVTPFRAQANRIRALAHADRQLTNQLGSLQFVVDTVHGFQGDERDVIFFSPVVSAGTGEGTLRFLKNHGNLFNVAITRARSELVVVGDRQAATDSGVAYLAGFAEYASGLGDEEARASFSANAGPEYPVVAHPELVSEWERIFYRAMYSRGLRPIPQYAEAPFILDFALFDGQRKLDIEIDGENYHRNWDGELCRRDQIRSRRLHDLGWDVMRFWVYEIRDDLEASVSRVKAWMRAEASSSNGRND